ncbi:MAG TPA: hypothetical protein VHF26_24990, partial [Trebonia sp.]|nr:hypothetical protein [Trebonia sp.]
YQMLYGVRPDEQRRLAGAGAKVRVYVPYGEDWYRYLVRRLAERPANLALFLRSLAARRRSPRGTARWHEGAAAPRPPFRPGPRTPPGTRPAANPAVVSGAPPAPSRGDDRSPGRGHLPPMPPGRTAR